MTVELHDSSSGGGRSKASDSHEYTRDGDGAEGQISPATEMAYAMGWAALRRAL